MKKSKFWEGLTPEQYSYITGINETVEDKTLIRPHSRYIMASTDYSDGVSLRKLGLSSDGFGYGRLPYDGTGIYSGFARGMGIFQLQGNASNFATYFTQIVPTTMPYATTSASSWDQWGFSSVTKTNIGTYTGRASAPFSNALPCHVYSNFVDSMTDFMQLNGAWDISGTTTPAPLIQQGPIAVLTTGSGVLSGYYAWCYTFVDANGNESQPSPLVASGNLSSNSGLLAITPGANITQAVWAKIRIYRTVTNSAAVTASGNPIFSYVYGLDVIITGSSTYNVTDNTPDTSLSSAITVNASGNPNVYLLQNVNYVNGALAALDTSAVCKFLVGWNNALWGGYWNISGTDFPIHVYYSASFDNSQSSTGNVTSWNNTNYLIVGTLEDGKIIGLYPGLQGRLYVFKEFSAYIIQSTGNSAIPYSCTPISNGFGLYHHSIAEVGGAVIGRAKDGIYQFNGSSFKPIAHPIYKTMNRLIQPDADSGVYDSAKMRYYLAVCDSNISNSFQIEVPVQPFLTNNEGEYVIDNEGQYIYNDQPSVIYDSIINCFNNTVLVYDLNTQTWETHRREPVQVFGRLKDNSGREKIFALGMSGDIFCLIDGNCFGPCFSFIGGTNGNITYNGQVLAGTNALKGYPVFIPFFMSSSGSVQFSDYSSVISSNQYIPFNGLELMLPIDPLPSTDPNLQAMVLIPNQQCTFVSMTGSNGMVIQNSIGYLPAGSNNYSVFDLNNNQMYMWPDGGISVGAIDTLNPINELFNPPPTSWDKLLIIPERNFGVNGSYATPIQAFVTPPFGIRLNDMAQKVFQMFRLQIKGAGLMYVYGFKDGNNSYQLGPFACTPDESHSFVINSNPINNYQKGGVTQPNSYQQMIHLNGLTAKYMRFMVWMVRGTGWFEIQDFTCYSRVMQELDNG